MRLITTSTVNNADISPGTVGTVGLLTQTETATAPRYGFVRVFVDQVAGNGTYTIYNTVQRGGAGSAYEYENRTTLAVPSGITAWTFIFSPRILDTGDVLKTYLIGLAGDTTTPDVITEFWDNDALTPTTPDTKLDISATGEAGLDFDNIKDATGGHTLTNIRVPNVTLVDTVTTVDTTTLAITTTTLTNPPSDSSGITTLLSRLTGTRAGYLDLLGSFLNSSVAAVKATVDLIKAKTDNLPGDPADESLIEAAITAAKAAVLVDTALIKAKTNNLPASPAAVGSQMDLVNAPNATAITAINAGQATAASITTVLNRLGAWTGSGRNSVLGALQSVFRKDTDASVPTDINANLGSGIGTAGNTTDSLEALRDRGDTAWTTGSGGASSTAIADAVWDEARAGHVAAGSFGQGVASVQGSVTGSIASVTGNVGGNVVGSVGSVVGAVGSVTGNLGGNVVGTVPDSAGTTTLLARLTNGRALNLDVLAGWTGTLLLALRALARKDSTSADLGGTFDPTTDSLEALREKTDTLASIAPVTNNETITEL